MGCVQGIQPSGQRGQIQEEALCHLFQELGIWIEWKGKPEDFRQGRDGMGGNSRRNAAPQGVRQVDGTAGIRWRARDR